MKKNYTAPIAEKIEFDYREQLVASGGSCKNQWINYGPTGCIEDNEYVKNLLD